LEIPPTYLLLEKAPVSGGRIFGRVSV